MKKLIVFFAYTVFISQILAQPVAPIRMCAEWEPAQGALIRWPLGIPSELVKEIAESDTVYLIVDSPIIQMEAAISLQQQDVNIDHVQYIIAETNSHWTRDWGPISIFDGNGNRVIVDPMFEGYPWVSGGRDWAIDDQINSYVAAHLNTDIYQLPLFLTGGNIMTDGHGIAYATAQMIVENLPICSESDFFEYVHDYTGINDFRIINNTENYGIQHIDCAAKLLDEETILIKRLPLGHSEYQRIETAVEMIEQDTSCYGRPYDIVRIDCEPYTGNEVAAYTNSLILNNKVYVPLFGIDSDGSALETYQNAMPGYEVIGFFYSDWYYYDALHCRTRGIFDKNMILIHHKKILPEVGLADSYQITAYINDMSESGLIADEIILYWRSSQDNQWISIQMNPLELEDFYQAEIPGQPGHTMIDYYISATNNAGRTQKKPSPAPEGFYSFTVIEHNDADEHTVIPMITDLTIYPNPFSFAVKNRTSNTTISFNLTETNDLKCSIYNIKGELIKILADKVENPGYQEFRWDGIDRFGSSTSSGIYFCLIEAGDQRESKKIILIR